MCQSLYKVKEGEVAPPIPDFLKGRFFELHIPLAKDGTTRPSNTDYVGWVWVSEKGTLEFGEPGA